MILSRDNHKLTLNFKITLLVNYERTLQLLLKTNQYDFRAQNSTMLRGLKNKLNKKNPKQKTKQPKQKKISKTILLIHH